MYLTIYDLSGMQRYIFSTGKLKEQVGASQIIHDLLYRHLPEVLGKDPEAWEEEDLLNFTEQNNAHIVYIGGGNAVVLYKDENHMQSGTRQLQQKVLELTGNKLRLCFASMEVKDGSSDYYKVYTELMKKMAVSKHHPSPIRLATGFAIGEHDPITLEPITLIKPEGDKDKAEYGAVSRIQKRRSFKAVKKDPEKEGTRAYATEFERFRKEDRKSFVAVVHIDGDSMGRQIEGAVEKFSKEKNFKNAMLEMRAISQEIDLLYRKTMDAAIDEIYPSGKSVKAELPLRPLISDGDDITFLIEAEKAFDFVEAFMSKLKENRNCAGSYPKMKKHSFKVSASAGVVFVHDKFPFYVAYDIAEELCKSAKEVKKEDDPKVSTVDFHIVQSGMRSGLEEYRTENYIKQSNSKTYRLNLRPYFFHEDDKAKELNSYKNFKELRSRLRKAVEGEEIARGKLKALRNAYAQSVGEAQRHYEFMLERDEGRILRKIAKHAFTEGGEGFDEGYAYFFDALEVMDFEVDDGPIREEREVETV